MEEDAQILENKKARGRTKKKMKANDNVDRKVEEDAEEGRAKAEEEENTYFFLVYFSELLDKGTS